MKSIVYHAEYKITSEGDVLIEVMEGELVQDVLDMYLTDNEMNLGEGEVTIIKAEKI